MNNNNVQKYGFSMEIENAGVVYQQNYTQLPLPAPSTYNQFNIPPPQQLSHQSAYLGGYDQHNSIDGCLSDVGTQTSVE